MMPARASDEALTAALRTTQGNVNAAARLLGYRDAKGTHVRLRRNPHLWPEGVARREPGGGPRVAAWQPCQCGEWWCRLHGQHVSECPCPPIEEWTVDPYAGTTPR